MSASTSTPPGKAISQDLQRRIDDSVNLPDPEQDGYWHIESKIDHKKKKRKRFFFFAPKGISDEELATLRKAAMQAPGNTRARVKSLLNDYPTDSTLLMLSAICTSGMIVNSASQKDTIVGYRNATKDAALALVYDGISLYNADNFFRIYFMYLDRFKRNQLRTYEMIRSDPMMDSIRRRIHKCMQMIDFLLADRKKTLNILGHLKKKLKTSHYPTYFTHYEILTAARNIEKGKPKENMKVGSAKEMIAYLYAFAIAAARIPILSPLVDQILSLLPDTERSLYLRKISIASTRYFMRFKMYAMDGNKEKMSEMGKVIFKENMMAVQKIEGAPILQVYESDPFFNLAFIAELTAGMYDKKLQEQIINGALRAIETVLQRDMTKNHVFAESATVHSHKLAAIRDGQF